MFPSKDSSRRITKGVCLKTSQLLEQPVLKYKKEGANEECQNTLQILSELKIALCEKSKIECENMILKQECLELQKQNAHLNKIIDENKVKFNNDFNQFKAQLEHSEQNIIESGKRYFVQQKKYLNEIKALSLEKERIKSAHLEREKELLYKIEKLEINKLQQQKDHENLKATCDEYLVKSNKYKIKLKSAVSMINDLNTLLIQYTTRPDKKSVKVQTSECDIYEDFNVESKNFEPCYWQKDDILLSEIFFRSKTFCETELLFKNEDVSQ